MSAILRSILSVTIQHRTSRPGQPGSDLSRLIALDCGHSFECRNPGGTRHRKVQCHQCEFLRAGGTVVRYELPEKRRTIEQWCPTTRQPLVHSRNMNPEELAEWKADMPD